MELLVVLTIGSKPGLLVTPSVINDIAKGIDSPLRLFVDDCLLHRVINGVEDTNRLQEDLNKLSEWANTWELV